MYLLFLQNAGVDIDAVFGNIEDVADVSQSLLTLLENAVNGQDFEDQLLGKSIINRL
jgi:2-methylisocitrate lyase-like PEP mutase family enzyme